MSSPDTEEGLPHTIVSTASSNAEESIAETVSTRDHYDDPVKVLTPHVSRATSRPPLSRKATSIGTTGTTDPAFDIDWEDQDDTENPRNWPLWYKGLTIGFISWSTLVVYVPGGTPLSPRANPDTANTSHPQSTLLDIIHRRPCQHDGRL